MKVCKITDRDGYTRRGEDGETKWGKNVCHRITKKGNVLCSNKVFHCYKSPYLAILMNPIHGGYDSKSLLLWEAKIPKIVADDGTKSGCKTLTTIKKIPVPTFTTEQLVEIAIRCAMKVYDDEKFKGWAMKWITNQDTSESAAESAIRYAAYATDAARSAAYADESAIRYAAESAIRYAAAAYADESAIRYAAESAIRYAAYATLNLIDIIHEVMEKGKNDTT